MVKSFIISFFSSTRVGAWGMWLTIVRVCSTILVNFFDLKKKKRFSGSGSGWHKNGSAVPEAAINVKHIRPVLCRASVSWSLGFI
jgi:hypothetical protein